MSSFTEIETEKIPLDEFGEIRRSHLDMPLVTFPLVAKIINKWLDDSVNDDWLDLLSDDIDVYKFTLVSDMSQALIEEIGIFLLKHLRIQISANPHEHIPTNNKSTSAHTSKLMNSYQLFDGCSYCRVTREDVQFSFGGIFDTCFGQFLETVQSQSYDSVMLHTLLSVEIAKNVNSALSHSTVRSHRSTPDSKLKEIARRVINILQVCTYTKRAALCAQSIQGSPGTSHLKGHTDIQHYPTEGCIMIMPLPGDTSLGCSSFEEVKDPALTCRKTHTLPYAVSLGNSGKSRDLIEAKNLEQLRKCSIDETFLRVCLEKLIDHIVYETNTSVLRVNFPQIVTCVSERLVGEQSYTVPKRVKNIHITIYKELCRKFRSKYVLRVLMEKCDPAFVAAFVEALKGQLKKSMEKTNKFKMWRNVRSSKKVSLPACENKAAESHSEENAKKNATWKKRLLSGIMRICSFIFSPFRNAFTFFKTKQYQK